MVIFPSNICTVCSSSAAEPRGRHIKAAGPLRLLARPARPLKERRVQPARIDDIRHIEQLVEKMIADEMIHPRQEHAPIRMRVIPAGHLQLFRKLVALAREPTVSYVNLKLPLMPSRNALPVADRSRRQRPGHLHRDNDRRASRRRVRRSCPTPRAASISSSTSRSTKIGSSFSFGFPYGTTAKWRLRSGRRFFSGWISSTSPN